MERKQCLTAQYVDISCTWHLSSTANPKLYNKQQEYEAVYHYVI